MNTKRDRLISELFDARLEEYLMDYEARTGFRRDSLSEPELNLLHRWAFEYAWEATDFFCADFKKAADARKVK